jgi:hypothetical protein
MSTTFLWHHAILDGFLLREIVIIREKRFEESRNIAQEGGGVAGEARRNIEQRSGRPVLTPKSALDFTRVLGAIIESGNKGRE